MNLICKANKYGLCVHFGNKNYNIIYPSKIWKKFSLKQVWIENIAYLQTICMPFVSRFRKLEYNTGKPYFKNKFDELIIGEIPGAVEKQKNMSTKKALEIFRRTKYIFNEKSVIPEKTYRTYDYSSVVPLSLGKDSLLTLGLSREIGLNPAPVYINDTVSKKENNYKVNAIRKLAKQEKLNHVIIENQTEKLNDFETWNTCESRLGYMHMLSSFCFLSIPIAEYYNAGYIIIGNENNMSNSFLNKDGIRAYPSFGQTSIWTKKQNYMLEKYFGIKVFSLIEQLSDIFLFKILHKRYPEIGKYQLSCADLDDSSEKRWCCNCSTCSNAFINLLANGVAPKKLGFRKNMLEKKYKDCYPLFNGKKIDIYERNPESKLESMLSFYFAYKNSAKGYLIDLFKKKFLEEAKSMEDELIKKFFKIHKPKTIPFKLRNKILGIYKEELSKI